MFYVLILAAVVFFIAHVVLLLASFRQSGFASQRYFYSHLTLWVTGALIFLLAFFYGSSDHSNFLAYFDTPLKKAAILLFTLGLSLVAHLIVKFLVLPLLRKNG